MADMLSSTQLRKLKEHQYSATGTSLIEPQMQIFWRWLVEQIPKTWAPNSITMSGLIINIVSTVILVFFSPDAKAEAPRVCYLLCAVGLFLYQSLDAIDGKQARRTGTNTPLGELFDHGCDSVSTVFVALGVCIALRLGSDPGWMMFEVFAGIFLFYQAHWQTYVTGTLRFSSLDVTEVETLCILAHTLSGIFGPSFWDAVQVTSKDYMYRSVWYITHAGRTMPCFDVTETQFGVIAVYLISAIFGPSFWDTTVPGVALPLRVCVVTFSIFPALLQCKNNLMIIHQGGKGKNKSTVADTSTIFPLVPIAIVLVLGVMIAIKSPTHLYQLHPSLYLISFGMVSAKVTNRLVIAHMTKSEMALIDSSILGPALLFFNQYFNSLIPEYALLWVCFMYITWDIMWYSACVCKEICDFLGIYCFDITSKPEKVRSSSFNGKSTSK